MTAVVTLHGYHYSVYSRIARLALIEKEVGHTWREVDPFAAEVPEDYLAMQPFGRVPTLVHGDFVLYETAAITRYVDEAFPGPPLQPTEPAAQARMVQIVGIVDSYGYWPMVRQVYAHRVFRPRVGEAVSEAAVAEGLAAARRVLGAIERLCADASFLTGPGLSLADLHLAPMVAYLALAPEGAAMMPSFPRLADWWARMADRPSLGETDPGLP